MRSTPPPDRHFKVFRREADARQRRQNRILGLISLAEGFILLLSLGHLKSDLRDWYQIHRSE